MGRRGYDPPMVDVHRAWTAAEIRDTVGSIVRARLEHADRGGSVVIKPNLNNDLPALTGNSTDLRVLCAILEALVDLGFRDLTVADGPNVGIARRGIDVFRRLRVAALGPRYNAKIVDLNRDEGLRIPLYDGAPRVAHTWTRADVRISVPKVKTHAEAGLSCAVKNHVGTCVGQDKRLVHRDLARNIAHLAVATPPHHVIVDGVVAMEGNGPGDGEPYRLGAIFAGDDPFEVDVVVARTIGIPWRDVPALSAAIELGFLDENHADATTDAHPTIRTVVRAPPRSRLAILSERHELAGLKRRLRPLLARPVVGVLAYRAGIVQDVYSLTNDGVSGVRRVSSDCGTCHRCANVCPTGLLVAKIGVRTDASACIACTYCWWACPSGAIALDGGPLGAMERPIIRYKAAIERL